MHELSDPLGKSCVKKDPRKGIGGIGIDVLLCGPGVAATMALGRTVAVGLVRRRAE
jgi:hypothetical protein